MKPLKLALRVASSLILSACAGPEPDAPPVWGTIPATEAELQMYVDIRQVQEAEQGKSIFRVRGTDSISFSRAGVDYRFANPKAYRAFIKHRLDSMVARGYVVPYDTTIHPRPTVRTEGDSISSTTTYTME